MFKERLVYIVILMGLDNNFFQSLPLFPYVENKCLDTSSEIEKEMAAGN